MIYFLIPVYNEESNIPSLHTSLLEVLPNEDKFFVFSDDGSSDKSLELISTLFKDLSFHIISDGKNYGPGHAFNVGFEWILNRSVSTEDLVITIEADNTSDLAILPNMVTINRLGFDLVLASVYAQGGFFSKTSFIRVFASSIANLILRYAFDVKVLTLSSFYRVYKIELLRAIKKNNTTIISEFGFISMVEVLTKAIKVNAKIIEHPMVLHSDKRVGKSKMKLVKTTMAYLRFLLKRRKAN